MKSIIIGSNASGGGKTTFTLGLMQALKNRKLKVQGYKVGPDYIDPAFHKEVTKILSRNLDVHLMGEDGVKLSYLKGHGDVGIIEGVMGIYDGIGISTKASTYDVSRILDDMPIILVITPKGMSNTLCAVINGIRDYKNAAIAGIVLNGITEKYYKLLKAAVEENCNMKVFGYLPKNEEISLSSRHLGLVQSMEVLNLHEKLELCGQMVEEHVDVDAILDSMKEYNEYKEINAESAESHESRNCTQDASKCEVDRALDENAEHHNEPQILEGEALRNKKLKIAVALDKAFNFYYRDNIELLEKIGEVQYFSPMKDEKLPEGIDFLYIGGGYPEVFKEELAQNESMKKSIKTALENGLKCYAECGGYMYLTESIEGSSMVGFIQGNSTMTKRLQHFGYCTVEIDESIYHKKLIINAHEFHKSVVESSEKTVYHVSKKQYDGEIIKWKCGCHKNNVLAGYAHINFLGNLELFKCVTGYDENVQCTIDD